LNRSRLLFEIVNGIRDVCGKDFLIGVRLSPEKFGMELKEVKALCKRLVDEENIDFLDISLWDCFKLPEDIHFQDLSLLEHFTEMDYKHVKLTVAGKISNAKEAGQILDVGVDFVTIGRSGILHHDFPIKVMENPDFIPVETPVSEEHLRKEGLSDTFINYMKRWPNFVK